MILKTKLIINTNINNEFYSSRQRIFKRIEDSVV